MGWWQRMVGMWCDAGESRRSARSVKPSLEQLDSRILPTAALGDFGGSGLWLWQETSGWSRLSTLDAQTADLAATGTGYTVVGDFGATGLWRWTTQAGWSRLSGLDAEQVVVGRDGTVVGDFGGQGLWRWNAQAGWLQLTPSNPEEIDVSVNAGVTVIGDFGNSGVWRWSSAGGWAQLTASNPEDIAASPDDGAFVADFGSSGLWGYGPTVGWLKISNRDAQAIACSEDGVPYAVFNDGVYEFTAAFNSTRLTTSVPTSIDECDDGFVADFGASGVWKYEGGWQRLTTAVAQGVWGD